MTRDQRQRYLDAMGIQRWVPRVGPVPVQPVAAPAAQAPDEDVSTLDWDQLTARVTACTACPELAAGRTQTVFGVGERQ
ncbi:MAG: uracil-DNA glycosylase, partial [Thioalkalivibrio sp.]